MEGEMSHELQYYAKTYTVLYEHEQYTHRRSMKEEAKAKVVASVWGTEFIQFLAALAIVT